MDGKVHGTFVCQKINKIRWKPEDLSSSNFFLSGSWDDEVNALVLWEYPTTVENPDRYPCEVARFEFNGDVTEIIFINEQKVVVSSSNGFVKLLSVNYNKQETTVFKELISWENLHHFNPRSPCPCTGVTCFEEDIATVGEDGRIALLTARNTKPLRIIDDADSCSLRCTCFLKHNEILTGNLRGHMKVWDLKSQSDKPASTFMLSGDQVGVNCVTFHPTQRHMLLAGGDDGSLTVWDMRHNTFPVTSLSAHSDMVNELKFHPKRPEHLFSCSASGELWHWNTSSISRGSRFSTSSDLSLDENPWLSSDAAKHRIELLSAMPKLHKPINSLDVNDSRLLCGCDNEAVYIISNVIQ